MTTDNERRSSAEAGGRNGTRVCEPSDYKPQRDLPMPTYEFQTPSQSSGGLHAPSEEELADRSPQERASLRNFSVRAPALADTEALLLANSTPCRISS
jgi:hypothetical protein